MISQFDLQPERLTLNQAKCSVSKEKSGRLVILRGMDILGTSQLILVTSRTRAGVTHSGEAIGSVPSRTPLHPARWDYKSMYQDA